MLREHIYTRLHQLISTSTLKRVWGYTSSQSEPSRSTLDVLASFVGYGSYADFCAAAAKGGTDASNPVISRHINVGIGITKGTGRLDERSDLTIRIRNNQASDYVDALYLLPYYHGHITPEEAGSATTALAEGEVMLCGAYIPANGEAEVTFSFVPEYGGTVVFAAYAGDQYIGELPLEINGDTLTNYNAYLENKSYLSRDGDQWRWNVELADRIGAKMPHWVPSDSLCLRMTFVVNNVILHRQVLKEELHDYLLALPDSIGTGNYTFTCQMPVEVAQPGEYYFDSYLAEMANEERVSYCCVQIESFTIDGSNPTGIDETVNGKSVNGKSYTLDGRRLSGKPTARGIYIHNGRKVVVK